MPDIKVKQVEVKHSAQYGDRKVLHLEDGSKWNISEKKSFYGAVTGPGIYTAEFKEYNGKPYIAYIALKCALDGQNQPTANLSAGANTQAARANYEASLKQRMEADKKRQDDIRLEFYCGVAKDILIANKTDNTPINYADVMAMGKDLYKMHVATLDMLQAQEDSNMAANETSSQYDRAKAALEENNANPPF